MKTVRVVAVVGAVLALAAFRPFFGAHSLGKPSPERVQRMATERVNDYLDDLDATPEQRKAVHVMKDDALKEGRVLHEDNTKAREELMAQWDSPKMDSGRVHALVDARVDAMRAFAHKLADNAVELHTLLTPEQRGKVSEHIKERSRW